MGGVQHRVRRGEEGESIAQRRHAPWGLRRERVIPRGDEECLSPQPALTRQLPAGSRPICARQAPCAHHGRVCDSLEKNLWRPRSARQGASILTFPGFIIQVMRAGGERAGQAWGRGGEGQRGGEGGWEGGPWASGSEWALTLTDALLGAAQLFSGGRPLSPSL